MYTGRHIYKREVQLITVNMLNISSIVFCFLVLLIRMPASNDFCSGTYILSLRKIVLSSVLLRRTL